MSHNGHTTFCMQGMQIANLAVVLPVSATCLIPAHAVYTDTSVQIEEAEQSVCLSLHQV